MSKIKEYELVETHRGDWIYVDRDSVMRMTRQELQEYLELRGYAVYDDEPTALLRECALEDIESLNHP